MKRNIFGAASMTIIMHLMYFELRYAKACTVLC